jgi:hypothetical protein
MAGGWNWPRIMPTGGLDISRVEPLHSEVLESSVVIKYTLFLFRKYLVSWQLDAFNLLSLDLIILVIISKNQKKNSNLKHAKSWIELNLILKLEVFIVMKIHPADGGSTLL